MKQIDTIVNYCVEKSYIEADKALWLGYALEKRLTTILSLVPLTIVGLLLTDYRTYLAFIISFYSLRTLTNGWHAKSFVACFVCSIIGEIIFLGFFTRLWSAGLSLIFLMGFGTIIWHYAPFSHPNMNLSAEEIAACRGAARKRLAILLLCSIVLRFVPAEELSCGIDLGISQVALALVIALVSQKYNELCM